MAIKKREVKKKLLKKFTFVEEPGSKHEHYVLYLDGFKFAATYMSRSHREISDTNLRLMAQQIGVNLKTLKQMVKCTFTKDEYHELIRQQYM